MILILAEHGGAAGLRTAEASRPHINLSNLAEMLFVLFEDEVVGHAGDVVADYARERFLFRFFLIVGREGVGTVHPEIEKFGDDALGVVFFVGE